MTAERDGVQNSVQDLDFSSDGKVLVVAVANLVLIYDAKEDDLLHRLRGHKDTVYTVAFVRDGSRFASGGADKTVIIWTRKVRRLGCWWWWQRWWQCVANRAGCSCHASADDHH